jgi:hypothetical protein
LKEVRIERCTRTLVGEKTVFSRNLQWPHLYTSEEVQKEGGDGRALSLLTTMKSELASKSPPTISREGHELPCLGKEHTS